ncbi:RNA polymerase sigma factor [Steroidobacter flavus]|uniref:RNA polymerase sigma factor n=1 Tax=Steroidobacter flavus TaxID=1842136 RepID=A0ABV8SY20_9GAMM
MLPHEGDVRNWLSRRLPSAAAVDDVVQEAYCRLAALESVSHIASGRAYFFRSVANIVIEQVRRSKVVHIDSFAEIEELDVMDDAPPPDRIVSGRRDLALVGRLIAGLPERCRRVFELRRVYGLPQRDVAEQLGVSENVVEQQSIRGLKLILKALAEAGAEDIVPSRLTKSSERSGTRSKD